MTHRVLLTQRFNDALLERLRALSPELEIVQKSVREEWDRMDTGSFFEGDEEILYCLMPPRDLSVAPRLKWVQLHTAGINQLVGHPILKSNILLTTSSGIHATSIGEFSIALMLALARHVPRMVRAQDRGEWPRDRWRVFMGLELRGKTLGVVGYGSIGRETTRIAKQGFGMRVLALSRSGHKPIAAMPNPVPVTLKEKYPDEWFDRDHLADMLAKSDFVLISVPLTEETRHLIGLQEFRAMKPTAFIVNIARGEILDEAALVQALKEDWIAGAGLDVFAQEPLPTKSELWKLENAILAPHISAATPRFDDRAVDLFSENLRRYLSGEPLLNQVKKMEGY